jgi:hypothetical protein
MSGEEQQTKVGREPGWTLWAPVPASFTTSTPAPVAHEEALFLFVRGTDGGLYQSSLRAGASWEPWQPIPLPDGPALSAPAAASFRREIRLYVRGRRDGLLEGIWKDGRWIGWTEVPGGMVATSDPAVAVDDQGLNLTVRGPDGEICYQRYDGHWRGWRCLEGPGAGVPAVVSQAGRLHLFIRTEDGAILRSAMDGPGRWSRWQEVPSPLPLASDPAGLLCDGILVLFACDRMGRVLVNRQRPDGIWTGWRWGPLGERIISRPAPVLFAGTIHLFAVGTDQLVQQALWPTRA